MKHQLLYDLSEAGRHFNAAQKMAAFLKDTRTEIAIAKMTDTLSDLYDRVSAGDKPPLKDYCEMCGRKSRLALIIDLRSVWKTACGVCRKGVKELKADEAA